VRLFRVCAYTLRIVDTKVANVAKCVRDECLNEHLFRGLRMARRMIESWKIDYNTDRPHSSLNGLIPTEFAARPTEGHNRNRLSL
jgi:putative transposase